MYDQCNPWEFGIDQLIGVGNSVSVLIAAVIGVYAVRNWREERIDARRFELSEEFLSLAYQAIDVFDYVRSPMGFSGEGESRIPQDKNETPQQKEQRDSEYVPIERLEKHRDFFDRVIKLRPSVMAVFGEGAARPLETILKQRNRIILAARRLSRANMRKSFQNKEDFEKHESRISEAQSIIWKDHLVEGDNADIDPVDIELEKMKKEALRTAGPMLDERFKKRGFLSFFNLYK